MPHVLSVKNLYKMYPKQQGAPAVDKISFHLNRGEVLGLLGPNGSGKTTTIQMLLGTLLPTSGSIVYFGKEFEKHRTEILQSLSFASAYTHLPGLLTVQENLEVFGRLYGLPPQETMKRIDPLLERFGILAKKRSRSSALSAGQITRLMLVKAFFMRPKIVLLDEPTASLDPDIAQEICEFILEQREKTGVSILFTSHKMEEAQELCDRIVFLKDGRIIADDLPKNLVKTISLFRIRLVITDGMKRTIALVEKEKFPYTIEHRSIKIDIDESQIPTFLNNLGERGITYASIKIEEPSLEDYFLQMARKRRI